MQQKIQRIIYRLFLTAFVGILVEVRGSPATASDKIRTQEYTVVIYMAERSLTRLPDVEFPMKKRYALPDVLFLGASLERNRPLKNPISPHRPLQKSHKESTYHF